jgi:hypothetical protein
VKLEVVGRPGPGARLPVDRGGDRGGAQVHGKTVRPPRLAAGAPSLATGAAFVALTPVAAASGAYLLLVYGLVQGKSPWQALIALRQPDGTLFEERRGGTRIYRPSSLSA